MFNVSRSTIATAFAISLLSCSVNLPINANAQSFSCANAQIPSEMAICNSESLLVKDEQVATLLASRLVTATASGKMQDVSNEHGNWLRTRNACSNDMTCLEQAYDKRIQGLTEREF